jgi:thiosulfate dehydrogenase [quinone] large subunit
MCAPDVALHEPYRGGRIMAKMTTAQGDITLHNPPFVHTLFSTTKFAWLWAIIRLYVGYEWIAAGVRKVQDPAWMNGGEALKGFWTKALAVEQSQPKIAYDWYRDFINYMLTNGWYTWFAKLVAFGELLVGVALVVGAFVGIAAFFSAFMNWNYVMAGSASTNAMLLTLAILLIIAWKVAGWYGLDRYLLRSISSLRGSDVAYANDTSSSSHPTVTPGVMRQENRRTPRQL